MYGKIAALVSTTAVVGFVAGAASMGSYVASQPDPESQKPAPESGAVRHIPVAGEAVKRIGTPVQKQVCRITNLPGKGEVPVVSQMGHAASAVADTVGGITGAGKCGPEGSLRA